MLKIPNFDPFVFKPITLHLFGRDIGPLGLRWYALSYIAGIVLGWLYAARMIKTPRLWGEKGPPVTNAELDDLILWLAMGIVLGGRLGYVVFYGSSQGIWSHPVDILKIWDGGMSFHGGLIGVILALSFFVWRHKGTTLRGVGDLVAPAAPLGLFFGRIANFINGELWGRPTNLPWGMIFCNDNIRAVQGSCPVGARHPSQLYEATLEGIVLFVILRIATHHTAALKRPGLVSGIFLIGYGLARLSLENVREPDGFMPDALRGFITMGMILCIPMIALGAWLIWRARTQPANP